MFCTSGEGFSFSATAKCVEKTLRKKQAIKSVFIRLKKAGSESFISSRSHYV
jgi:hypothetical protein